jgi:hypothetical protein
VNYETAGNAAGGGNADNGRSCSVRRDHDAAQQRWRGSRGRRMSEEEEE